jgi:hypothetical protein
MGQLREDDVGTAPRCRVGHMSTARGFDKAYEMYDFYQLSFMAQPRVSAYEGQPRVQIRAAKSCLSFDLLHSSRVHFLS